MFLDYFVIISNFDIHVFFNSTLLDLFWRTEPQQKTVIKKTYNVAFSCGETEIKAAFGSQTVQSIIEFIAFQRAYMHMGRAIVNKINLQLNKNTIFII